MRIKRININRQGESPAQQRKNHEKGNSFRQHRNDSSNHIINWFDGHDR
nr:MAG TPA: hypothetical protein [Caudoviricetes sp.]